MMISTKLPSLKTLVMVAMIGVVAACADDNKGATASRQERLLTFGATIEGRPVASWEKGQKVGVYVLKDNAQQAVHNLLPKAENLPFMTPTTSGFFAAVGEKYEAPAAEAVDLIAYSPYTPAIKDFALQLNISDQSDPQALDLLYANNVKGWSKRDVEPTLQFVPQMAQLKLLLTATDNTNLTQVAVRLLDFPTQAIFDLGTGTFSQPSHRADIVLHQEGKESAQTATAFLFPTQIPLRVEIALANGYKDTLTIARSLAKGAEVTEYVRVSAVGVETTSPAYRSWKETPLITAAELRQPHLRYVTHFLQESGYTQMRNYSLLYDTALKMAHWVAYPLSRGYLVKAVGRQDTWTLDPFFSAQEQAVWRHGVRGYDRGHQIPSADRLLTLSANQQTFYYTNLTPQRGILNAGIWAALEKAVRDWANGVDTLYVVTGAVATSSTTSSAVTYVYDNDDKPVAVPQYYYKALCAYNRTKGTAKTIAFKFDNHTGYDKNAKNYMDYALSVESLERLTGRVFFPAVPAQYKQSVTW